VQLTLRKSPSTKGGLFYNRYTESDEEHSSTLFALCEKLAPTLDVKLTVTEKGNTHTAIDAQDWIQIPGEQLLLDRCPKEYEKRFSIDVLKVFAAKAAANLRVLKDARGSPIARICITAADRSYWLSEPTLAGAVTVGGLFASRLQGIAGFIIGESTRASRDCASPAIPSEELARWAAEQASLIPLLYQTAESQASAAQTIRICGGHTGDLPIVKHCGQWLTAAQISSLELPEKLVILDWFTSEYELKHAGDLVFHHGIFITNASGFPAVFQDRSGEVYGGSFNRADGLPLTLLGAVVEAAALGWGVELAAILAANNLDRQHEVEIGLVDGKGLLASGYVIHKPTVH
jgi:hypothetical protein